MPVFLRGGPLAGLAAIAFGVGSLGGCAVGPEVPAWFSASMLEELQTAEEYSDYMSARYAGVAGEPAAAATYYRRAFARSPDDADLLEHAAFASLIAGEADEAVGLAASADAAVSARAPTAQLALVFADIASGKGKLALQRLKTSPLGAINADLSGYLTAWLTAADDPDQGLASLAQMQSRRLLGGEQEVLKGLILMNAGRDDKALEAFAQAQRLPLGAPDLVAALSAKLMASRGDFAGAHRTLALDVDANGPSAATDNALALIQTGQLVARPKFTTRQGAALIVYLSSINGIARTSPELAALRYSLTLFLDPSLAPARLELADALRQEDRPEDAIEALRAILPDSPWAADAWLSQAWLLEGLDRHGEALAAAEQAVTASKRREILIGAGDLNRLNRANATARKLYDQVIAADLAAGQADWRVLYSRATARTADGDWKGAESDLLTAMALEPDRPELQNALGYGWVDRGQRVEEGMELIRKAVAARPDQGFIVDSLGWAHYRLGEYDAAVEQLERAAELSPSDGDIIDHLGDAYWRTGREMDARYQWTAALGLDPDPARVAQLKQKLDAGLPVTSSASLASRP